MSDPAAKIEPASAHHTCTPLCDWVVAPTTCDTATARPPSVLGAAGLVRIEETRRAVTAFGFSPHFAMRPGGVR